MYLSLTVGEWKMATGLERKGRGTTRVHTTSLNVRTEPNARERVILFISLRPLHQVRRRLALGIPREMTLSVNGNQIVSK